jgi:hypothetical protein
MRRPDFILTEREQILIEWERFARTCVPASITMNVGALRDHAKDLLTEIAADLNRFEGAFGESKGHAPAAHGGRIGVQSSEAQGTTFTVRTPGGG